MSVVNLRILENERTHESMHPNATRAIGVTKYQKGCAHYEKSSTRVRLAVHRGKSTCTRMWAKRRLYTPCAALVARSCLASSPARSSGPGDTHKPHGLRRGDAVAHYAAAPAAKAATPEVQEETGRAPPQHA